MDGNSAPAQNAGGQRHVQRRGGKAPQRTGGAAQLQHPGESGVDKLQLQPEGGGQIAAEQGKSSACIQQPHDDREAHHKAAYIQQRPHGLLHCLRKRLTYVNRIQMQRRDFPAVILLAEEQTGQQGGEHLAQIEQQPGLAAAEGPGPHCPDDESGAGVVAEAQQALTLPGGNCPAAFHIGDVGRTQGIAAGESHQQRGGSRPGDAVDPGSQRRQQPAQIARQSQPVQQYRQHEEGEQRGKNQGQTQLYGVAAAFNDLAGAQGQGGK